MSGLAEVPLRFATQSPLSDVVQLFTIFKNSFLRSTDIPYSWSCYETVEEIQALLHCLSYQGGRERALKRSLKEQMESIAEGIRRFVKL